MKKASTTPTTSTKSSSANKKEELIQALGFQETKPVWTCKKTGASFLAENTALIALHIKQLVEKEEKEQKKKAQVEERELKKKCTPLVRKALKSTASLTDRFSQLVEELIEVAIPGEKVSVDFEVNALTEESKKKFINQQCIYLTLILKKEAPEKAKDNEMTESVGAKAKRSAKVKESVESSIQWDEDKVERVKKALKVVGVTWSSKAKKWTSSECPIEIRHGWGFRNDWINEMMPLITKIEQFQFKGQNPKRSLEELEKLRQEPGYKECTDEIKRLAKEIHELRNQHREWLAKREEVVKAVSTPNGRLKVNQFKP